MVQEVGRRMEVSPQPREGPRLPPPSGNMGPSRLQEAEEGQSESPSPPWYTPVSEAGEDFTCPRCPPDPETQGPVMALLGCLAV